MANKRNQNGGRHRGAMIYTPVAALLVLFIVIFGVSVFFRVATIEVSGSSRYTSDEIIAASGIEAGDNLFLIDRDAAALRIKSAMPYIADIRIDPAIPDKAVIIVTESAAFAAIGTSGDYWKVDAAGRILERSDFLGTSGLIRVTGVTLAAPKEGAKLAVDSAFDTQLGFLLDVFSAIDKAGIGGDVSELDISNISAITFIYKGNITVKLGGGDNAEHKISKLLATITELAELEAGASGTIDVSKDDMRSFIPN